MRSATSFVLNGKSALFTAILALFSFAGGCGPDLSELEEGIRQYTLLLADGYRNLDMTHIRLAATPRQAEKVYHHMASFGEGRVKMDATLAQLDFENIGRPANGRVVVRTREEWSYRYLGIDTGEQLFANRVRYALAYTLLRQEDRWLVDEVVIESATEDAKNPHLEFMRRPADEPPGSPAGPSSANEAG